jgi:hypothetical protein
MAADRGCAGNSATPTSMAAASSVFPSDRATLAQHRAVQGQQGSL